jgi:uncharacterized spore protein YtfJ
MATVVAEVVAMSFLETLDKATDAMTVARVFGEPIEKEGLTLVPVAAVLGGGGGGTGEGPEGKGAGSGGGFGLRVRPLGVFVMRGEEIAWRPTVDINRMILGGQIFAAIAVLAIRSIVRARSAR